MHGAFSHDTQCLNDLYASTLWLPWWGKLFLHGDRLWSHCGYAEVLSCEKSLLRDVFISAFGVSWIEAVWLLQPFSLEMVHSNLNFGVRSKHFGETPELVYNIWHSHHWSWWLGTILGSTVLYRQAVLPWGIHPASRGVAAHTAGLFRSVRGAKGGFPPWGLPKLRIFTFPPVAPQAREFSLFPPVGAPQAREFSLFPPVGAPQAREFSLFPPWGLPKLGNFHFSPPWGLPKLGNFHFSPPWGLPKLGNFHFSPPWQLPKLWNFHFSLPWRLSKLRNFK